MKEESSIYTIAVRLRDKKRVQNIRLFGEEDAH